MDLVTPSGESVGEITFHLDRLGRWRVVHIVQLNVQSGYNKPYGELYSL
jgi:hypothetical protein